MSICVVAFTHTLACVISIVFTSVCWHIVSLAVLKMRSVLRKATYCNFAAQIFNSNFKNNKRHKRT